MYDELCYIIKNYAEKYYYYNEINKHLSNYNLYETYNDYEFILPIKTTYSYNLSKKKWILYDIIIDNGMIIYNDFRLKFMVKCINNNKKLEMVITLDDKTYIKKIKLFKRSFIFGCF